MKESLGLAREVAPKVLTSHKVKVPSLLLSLKAIVEPLLDGTAKPDVKTEVRLKLWKAAFSHICYVRC